MIIFFAIEVVYGIGLVCMMFGVCLAAEKYCGEISLFMYFSVWLAVLWMLMVVGWSGGWVVGICLFVHCVNNAEFQFDD